MEINDLVSRLALACGIGLLIGLERGWRTRAAKSGSRTAGIRAFAISGLLGGVIGGWSQALDVAGSAAAIMLGLGFAAYSLVIGLFYLEENRADKTFSATTAVASMVTFALGAYAMIGDMRVAGAAAVATAAILAMRETIHGWVAVITWTELRSGLVLLAMSFVALPIMPDQPIGPYGGINLREIWIIAIALAAVSFFGYVAVKYWGATRGVLLSSIAGGLVSSTAVTISNARRAAAGEGAHRLLAAGVSLASTVMFLRVGAIVAALKPELLTFIAPSLIAAVIASAAFATISVLLQGRSKQKDQDFKLKNPFSFRLVVGFAVFLAAAVPAARWIADFFGASGAILGAAVVGVADVDAVTVAMAKLAPDSLSVQNTAFAILAAVSASTISKIGIGAMVGRGYFAAEIAAMGFVCHLAAGLALWVTFLKYT